MTMTNDGPIAAIKQLEQTVTAFRTAMTGEARAAAINQAVERAKAQFQTQGLTVGIDVAPDALLQKVAAQIDAQYDDLRAQDADRIGAEFRGATAALTAVMTAVSDLPDPLRVEDNTPTGEATHAIKRVGLLLEREYAERRLSGKTPSQVAALYAAADDRIDHVLKFLVQDQQQRGWPDIKLATDGDPAGVMALRDAIAAAQRARVEKNHPELVQAEAELKELQSSAVLDGLLRHARSRRLAVVGAKR
jgi:hypothetical protein